ncbi:hypothetical protein N7465_003418 [Penicillium sp. CMV-2018d]|nr:hypothetical protein N7465_003418 [Penicillium sp. CMV-2018d]
MTSPVAKITITATHTVHSEHPITLQDPFVLGPFDQLGHFATPVNAVWIYESSSSTDFIPFERLRIAISRLLDYYPHLTGRLHIDPETDVRSMTKLGTGIHLLEATCDAPLRSFASRSSSAGQEYSVFNFPELGNGLLSPWDMSLEGAQRDPVFTIQRTEFACSAVAIGMRLSHAVSGAGGFLGLYQDLAEIYGAAGTAHRGPIELTSPPYLPPFMITHMLHMDAEQREKALSEQPAAYSVRKPEAAAESSPATEAHIQQENPKPDPLMGRSLRFSPSAIATLKGQAVNPESTSARASTFTALSAHFWQRTHRARLAQVQPGSNEEQQKEFLSSAFGTSVNFVPHLGLPPRSFGNTIVTPVVELESQELAHAPLWKIADIINSRIRHVSAGETHRLGSWIAAQPKKSHIQLRFPCTPASFIATGWHHFPLYSGADLDESPVFASPVLMEPLFDGMIVFVEPKAKDGGVEAVASMKCSTWDILDNDEEFINVWDRKS